MCLSALVSMWFESNPHRTNTVAKTVILTEGSTDVYVMSEAMKLLYSHMVKFYSHIYNLLNKKC